MKSIEEMKNWLEDMWYSDFDIVVDSNDMSTKKLTFDTGDGYWDRATHNYVFDGKRKLISSMYNYSKFKRFEERLPEDIWDVWFELRDAKKLVELVFGSKRTKYDEIEELVKELK